MLCIFSKNLFAECSSNFSFQKILFRNPIGVSNNLDPDEAWHFVRTDLGPDCLPTLSEDRKGHTVCIKRVKQSGTLPYNPLHFYQNIYVTSHKKPVFSIDANSEHRSRLATFVNIFLSISYCPASQE